MLKGFTIIVEGIFLYTFVGRFRITIKALVRSFQPTLEISKQGFTFL